MIEDQSARCMREAEGDETVYPGEEKSQGDLINVYKYPMGGNKGEEARLFSMVSCGQRHWAQAETQIPFKYFLFLCL